MGTQSTLQAKCLSELLSALDPTALTDSLTYLTLFGFVGGTAFWLYRMNEALALFEPLFIIPVLQVFWTFFATLNGGIFFREFMQPAFLQRGVGGFVLGVCVIFSGVYFLAPPPPPTPSTTASGDNSTANAATADLRELSDDASASRSSRSSSKRSSSRLTNSSSIDSGRTTADEVCSERHHAASTSRSPTSPNATAANDGSLSIDLSHCVNNSTGSTGSINIDYDGSNSNTSTYTTRRSSSSSISVTNGNGSSTPKKNGIYIGLRARAPSGEHSSDEVADAY